MTVYYQDKAVTIRDAEATDIDFLKTRLKKADADEVWASDHLTPEEALTTSFEFSPERYSLLFKGEVVGMFGLRPISLVGPSAIVWLMTSDRINDMKVRFLKLSRLMVRLMLTRYPVIYNFVDQRHRDSIAWLHWCGAKIHPSVPFGAERLPFHYFSFGAN